MTSLRKTDTFGFLVSLFALAVVVYAVYKGDLVERVRSYIRSDLLIANTKLRAENEKLKNAIEGLIKQSHRMEKALVGRTIQFSMLNETAMAPWQSIISPSQDTPESLDKESFLNQQIYRALLAEKKRWDGYHQAQYRDLLESTLEPAVVDSQYLIFQDEDSRETFFEVENALNLHKRFIRDIRLFHDEVQYRQKRLQEDPSYQLYDLKFNLEPFARESAMADSLQQAMAAMGAGIYPQESAQVLDRLGKAFIEPIQELAGWLEGPADLARPGPYNYNFYIVFGKKLINYADTLARQSLIPLAPLALGELDFFSRRINQGLVQLYEAGGQGNIDSTLLDMDTLGQDVQ
ncbi:MAG: hypothetical protein QNK29_09230 [Desulfobacterales bacterium]|nr:hypothetical protein [Desulfobacterales bacterium]MDX2512105.1 hypothetical protein [Desulfobacterales bacterium]